MKNKKRILSFCAVVLMSAVLIFSVVIIASEADHDCIGDGCPVCAQIEFCGSLLKTVLKSAVLLLAAAAVCWFVILIAFVNVSNRFNTPVSLKIKLIN